MPKIDPTITTGNILSIATMLGSCAALLVTITLAWGKMETRVTSIDQRATTTADALSSLRAERAAGIAAMELRVRSLETAGARVDTQLHSIEQILTRIENRLERMDEGRAAP